MCRTLIFFTLSLHCPNSNFDIIMTQGSQQGPKALFLPGQLVLFRNNPKMEKMPFRYKALSSIEHIHLLKPGDHARSLDEGEYSDMYLNQVHLDRLPAIRRFWTIQWRAVGLTSLCFAPAIGG